MRDSTRDRKDAVRRAGLELLIEGGGRVPVSGSCMEPLIPPGARVRIERCAGAELIPGDVIAVARGAGCVLHRYLGPLAGGGRALLTKADRARRVDEPWRGVEFVGRLVAVSEGDDGAERPLAAPPLKRLMAAALWLAWLPAVMLGRARRRTRRGGVTS